MLPLESVGFAKAGLYEFKSRKTSCASIEITVIMIVLKKTLYMGISRDALQKMEIKLLYQNNLKIA